MTQRVRALARGLNVVNVINTAKAPLSLAELHRHTGIDKATLLRILATLEDEGWVYRGLGDQRYRLTCKIQALGASLNVHDTTAEVAAPILDALQGELHWPSDISVYDGESMAIIETSRSRSPFVLNRRLLGYRPTMLQSAVGRAYLAFSDERRQRQILERVRRQGGYQAELASNAAYVAELIARVREQGYALRDPLHSHFEAEEEVTAMAVPILVHGEVQASLNLVWLKLAYPEQEVFPCFYARLQEAADQLAARFLEHRLY